MNNSKLLSNLPITKLNSETDYLGIIDKGEIIKTFLIGSKSSLDEIKMFSLYGDWGSGKSSLMKYLETELKLEFNTFFFEAWEFEKDENLAMSLLEYLTIVNTDPSEELHAELLKYGGRILRGLGKSIKLNIPLFPNGPGIELNPSAFVEEVSKTEELTFYQALKGFKTEFKRLEDFITKGNKPKYNIIFIDDLDRCEPQQVLNLMSAIKLFFTYGEKTIFFCGVDKKAVEEAVKTKYGKVVKANEYLEKIFDISFSMPDHNDLLKLVKHYFDDTYYRVGDQDTAISYRINEFLKFIEFSNPRRVKKVLNKYQMLRNFHGMQSRENSFPNIDMKDGHQRSYFETILVLYLIILHEFFTVDFENFLNFHKKKDIYSKTVSNPANEMSNINDAIRSELSKENFKSVHDYVIEGVQTGVAREKFFFICLSPLNVERMKPSALYNDGAIDIIVKEKYIDFLFYQYINSKHLTVWLNNSSSNSSLHTIKQLIKNLL